MQLAWVVTTFMRVKKQDGTPKIDRAKLFFWVMQFDVRWTIMNSGFKGFQCRLLRFMVWLFGLVQNTSSMDGQIKQLVYTLENAILNLPPGQEQMVWLIDFHGWGVKHSTPIKTAREIANILQNHYPERLHAGILFNPPRVFQAFMTVRFWLKILLYLQEWRQSVPAWFIPFFCCAFARSIFSWMFV